jgi:histidyl-tRNA synthetase
MRKVRGTRDIIPFDGYINFFAKIREHLLLYGFIEIHTPLFEFESVFAKNLGEMSDIVSKEMYYVSHVHTSPEEEKIVLRPELTASVMRAFLENGIQKSPWKVFSCGPVFRHERPQQGRFREFFQVTIEALDAIHSAHDIELISMTFSFFQKIIPHLFRVELNYLGTTNERQAYKSALYTYCLSKKELFPEGYIEELSEKNILRILDHKNDLVKNALAEAPLLREFLQEESLSKFNFIIKALEKLDIPYTINLRLIRGLDYYTGLVFEFSSSFLGSQNAIAGGGRYDTLAQQMGSKKEIPSLGVGIGVDRVLLLLEQMQKEKNSSLQKSVGIVLEIENEKSDLLYYEAICLKKAFIEEGIYAVTYFDKISLKSAIKKANQDGVSYVVIINEKSLSSSTYILKDMKEKKEQEELSLSELIVKIKN